MIVVNIQSAIPDAFSAKGPVVIDASVLPGTGEWAVHTFSFDQGFEITYNYAGTYAENDRKVRFYDIESEVQVGAGCAMLTVMPIDETAGGSDPTGDTHTAYLDYCTENGPDDAVYVLETSYGDIRIFMDADMKPIAVSLPQDIWSIP